MDKHQVDLEDNFDFYDEEERRFIRKPTDSRRKLEELMEQRQLKEHLADDYDYDIDDLH